MPVEAQQTAQGLEPERVGQFFQDCLTPLLPDEQDQDRPAEPGHSFEEPGRTLSGMEGEVDTAGAHPDHLCSIVSVMFNSDKGGI